MRYINFGQAPSPLDITKKENKKMTYEEMLNNIIARFGLEHDITIQFAIAMAADEANGEQARSAIEFLYAMAMIASVFTED